VANASDSHPGVDVRDESGTDVDVSDIRSLAIFLLGRLGMADDAELSITLVDEEAMAQLNAEWMDEPGPTDVLSFPMDELNEPAPGAPRVSGTLGDVVMCPAVAERQAVVAGHDRRHELHILLTHGVLHLLGHDHAEPSDERVMFSRQAELVADYSTAVESGGGR
jgi:probable rRNA maturation factor